MLEFTIDNNKIILEVNKKKVLNTHLLKIKDNLSYFNMAYNGKLTKIFIEFLDDGNILTYPRGLKAKAAKGTLIGGKSKD
jgi:hypothetical protein